MAADAWLAAALTDAAHHGARRAGAGRPPDSLRL